MPVVRRPLYVLTFLKAGGIRQTTRETQPDTRLGSCEPCSPACPRVASVTPWGAGESGTILLRTMGHTRICTGNTKDIPASPSKSWEQRRAAAAGSGRVGRERLSRRSECAEIRGRTGPVVPVSLDRLLECHDSPSPFTAAPKGGLSVKINGGLGYSARTPRIPATASVSTLLSPISQTLPPNQNVRKCKCPASCPRVYVFERVF